jgi:hypothetical protein
VQALNIGPLTFRIYWARIGGALYVATKPYVLDDLRAATGAVPATRPADEAGRDDVAHAMLRLRPEHWQAVLDDYERSWAEKGRLACLENLGPLSGAARALAASGRSPEPDPIADLTAAVLGAGVYCPDGGTYRPTADGRGVTCTLHGSALEPRQATASTRPAAQAMRQLQRVTASLTFLDDGLHAVITVDRKSR